eukprot:CAMPEP_0181376780 /NCGR_PEP_ID=MMETSP1106-20121128/17506_1 /TAXON_ID=81844 /ORGANISM="Mantoniella antarctica, Strain SL-175" /LENGTH=459 /DNA_ID=CAMNT_0023495391 /DNA_START=209 /DNA_END=1584 /DNA_ORIENTATION=+
MSQQYGQYGQQYGQPGGGGYDYPQAPAPDPYSAQGGYYAAPSGVPPPQAYDGSNNAPLLPGYSAAAPHQMYAQQPPPQQQSPYTLPQQLPPQQQPGYDPYGSYDAVSYPSIPALIEHSQRATSYALPRPQSNPSRGGAGPATGRGGSRASKPQEESGATYGNSRYRCMLLPTRDGGDIEDVVCQVGLDGVQLFNAGGSSPMQEHVYPMDAVSRWALTDATILTVHVKPTAGGGAETSIAVSSDEATTGAIMDTLTTSAFQWCELRGYDPADTIEEKGGSAGRAGEWVNKKAGAGATAAAAGTTGAAAFASTRAAAAQPDVRWHERPEHCGWLTKKGEHLSTWRKRWFVLKDKRLGWFKSNDITASSKPRGVIDMDKVAQVCGAAKSDAGRANAVELIGSVEADKAGCKFLVADSERECDAWCTAIDAAVNGTDGTAAAAAAVASVGGGSSGGGGGAGGG